MRINKFAVAMAVIMTVVLVSPGLSFAQSTNDAIQAQIASLLAQIKVLQAQLASQQPGTTCYAFDTNLGIGATGTDVKNLQTVLTKDGEPTAISGTYDEITASAVSAFQEKYRNDVLVPYGFSAGTGYVGAKTRIELNKLFGCGTTTIPTPTKAIPVITSISPTVVAVGSQVIITGTNFGSNNVVLFNGLLAKTAVSSNGTTMTFTIPSMLYPDCATATGVACPQYLVNVTPGTYSVSVRTVDVTSNSIALIVAGAGSLATSTPSIHIYGADGTTVNDSAISANIGDVVTISGIPQNLQGLSYYTGTGNPPSGYYNRAFFFDQNFNNNCTNNDATAGDKWVMTCTASVPGSGAFYVTIYANGQAYRSNTVSITVAGGSNATSTPSPISSGFLNITAPTTLPAATVGQAYPTTQLTVAGGNGSYTWAVISTAQLPNGLSLSPTTGIISGTPTAAGLNGFNIGVRDSMGNVGTKIFYLNVATAPVVTVYNPVYSVSALSGYAVGQAWAANLQGAKPNTTFSMCGTHGSVVNVCTPNFGTTDAYGNWLKPGTFVSSDIGAWTEWIQFPDNTKSNTVSFTVATTTQQMPTISYLSQTSAKAGDTITIYGANLYANGIVIDGTNNVTPGSQDPSGSSMTFVVPSSIGIGSHRVQIVQKITGALSGSVMLNVIVAQQAPTVSSVSPTSAKVGDTMTVSGTNFDQYTFIGFDGANGTAIQPTAITVTSPTSLSFAVPSSLAVGSHSLAVSEKAGPFPLSNAVTLTVKATPVTYSPSYSISASGTAWYSGAYTVGQPWVIRIQAARPNTSFSMCGTHGSTVNVCTPNFGTTDGSGYWSKTGSFGATETGAWTEWVQFPDATSNQINFTVSNATTSMESGNSAQTANMLESMKAILNALLQSLSK